MQTTADVIGLWPSDEGFAADLEVALTLVRVGKHRGSVPPEYWSRIEEAADSRGILGATASDMARIAALLPRRRKAGSGPTAPRQERRMTGPAQSKVRHVPTAWAPDRSPDHLWLISTRHVSRIAANELQDEQPVALAERIKARIREGVG